MHFCVDINICNFCSNNVLLPNIKPYVMCTHSGKGGGGACLLGG